MIYLFDLSDKLFVGNHWVSEIPQHRPFFPVLHINGTVRVRILNFSPWCCAVGSFTASGFPCMKAWPLILYPPMESL